LESVAVDTFIKYLHQFIRADAFNDSVIINLIDSETIRLLTYYFNPTETAREHPISHHWTVDWDVAMIIHAMEELYPLQQEHRHFDQKIWIKFLGTRSMNVGPNPYLKAREVLKDLARCFTKRSNPWHNDKPHVNF